MTAAGKEETGELGLNRDAGRLLIAANLILAQTPVYVNHPGLIRPTPGLRSGQTPSTACPDP